jgi:hypothetical protein
MSRVGEPEIFIPGRLAAEAKESFAPLPADLVASDSEWDTKSNPRDPWLSTAFASRAGSVLYFRKDLPWQVRYRLDKAARALGVKVFFGRRWDGTVLLRHALPYLALEGVEKIRLALYFSPKDCEFALSWHSWRTAIHEGKVRQRNNLSGRVEGVTLRDLVGWAGKESLGKFLGALGIDTGAKSLRATNRKNLGLLLAV